MKKEWKRKVLTSPEEAEERDEAHIKALQKKIGGKGRVGRQRTPADVELRLQEAVERGADTLYIVNHSMRRFNSPLLPRVAELVSVLHLNLNLLTSFPPALLTFHKLEYLNLSRNEIAGAIPKGIKRLTCLKALILAHNRITSFPTTVAQMSCLRDLYLEGNPTLLYMPAELLLHARAEPGFLLKWNSIKDESLTEAKRATIERCEPVVVPSLLDLASCAVLVLRRPNPSVKRLLTLSLPQELQERLSRTYRCWHCRRKCAGQAPVVIIRRVDLAPRQKDLLHNRRSAGYWGGEPTATPCMFTFDRLGCYHAWHEADDPEERVFKESRKEVDHDSAEEVPPSFFV